MFPLHCNKCFQQKQLKKDLKFYITRCHHIICNACAINVRKNSIPSAAQLCPVCGRNYRAVEISNNMPASITICFEDPQNLLKRYESAAKFQAEQRALLDSYSFFQQRKKHKQRKHEYNEYLKIIKQLREEISKQKERINKDRQYIAYQQRRMEQMLLSNERMKAAAAGTAASRPPMRSNYSMKTPTLSASVVTLSENSENNDGNEMNSLYSWHQTKGLINPTNSFIL